MVEDALRAYQRGEVQGQGRFQMPMVVPNRQLRVLTATLPGAGEIVRVNPQYAGATEGHVNILFDGKSGELLAVVAGGELNVWRTGAPAGIACRYLAQTRPKIVGLLGSSRQARGQLVSVTRTMRSLEVVRVFSPTQVHRENFATQMSSWLGIRVEAVSSARAAVEGAEIVSLATNSRTPVVEAGWIAPGALVISITSGQLPQSLVAQSRVVIAWKEEIREGKQAREPYSTMIASGTWSAEKIAAELGEVMLGKIAARTSATDTVVFESSGMPIFDAAATAWAYRWALDHKVGTPITF
jgi:ornithine cyclodeaminase/alanine dehydrogenase-like protein (mu-crystallin family)